MMKGLMRVDLLILVLTCLLPGCTGGLPWARNIPEKDLVLTLRTNKETLKPGDTLKVQVKLNNRADHTGKLKELTLHPDSLIIECVRGGADFCMDLEYDGEPEKVSLKSKESLYYEMEFVPEVEEGDDFVLKAIYDDRLESNPVWIKVPREKPRWSSDYYEYEDGPPFFSPY